MKQKKGENYTTSSLTVYILYQVVLYDEISDGMGGVCSTNRGRKKCKDYNILVCKY
jgi:hypothetical protein